ncbi:unnamed protein product [Arctogadus glacialis]
MLNSILSDSLDSLAHWKTLFVSFTNSAPWYTPELRTMKQTANLNDFTNEPAVHAEAYKRHISSYRDALNPPTSPPSSTAQTGTPASCSPSQQTPPSAGHQSTHLT